MKERTMAEDMMGSIYRIIEARTGKTLSGTYKDLATAAADVDPQCAGGLLIERVADDIPRTTYRDRFITVEEALRISGDGMMLRAYEKDLPLRPTTPSEAETWDKAIGGDARAQYQLGWAYEHGLGVEKSRTKSIRWYEASRDNGNEDALLALGNITWGAGIAWFDECAELLTKECEKGAPGGTFFLGLIHRSGHGWERDPAKAVQ